MNKELDTKELYMKEIGILFSRNGIKAVTMDCIAKELGISKKTLYKYFSDKNQLVEEIVLTGSKMLKEYITKILLKASNSLEAIIDINDMFSSNSAKINPLFFSDLEKYHIDIHNRIFVKGDIRNYEVTMLLFERGVSQGIFSDDINIEMVNEFFHNITHLDKFSEMDCSRYSREDFNKSILIPYLYGICSIKGRELMNNIDFENKINKTI